MLIFKGNDIETNLHTLIILDFEKFLTSQREEWETRQKEVEAKFLELSSLSDKLAAVPSEPKKRKRKVKSDNCPQVQQDPFASYAAELQVCFFRKVIIYY